MPETVIQLLQRLGDRAAESLRTPVEIRDKDVFPRKEELFTRNIWLRVQDVVVVVADLKNSTRLSFKNHPKTSAQLYEAVTKNAVDIVSDARFDASFVAIQGDGLFALYHGQRAYERALCAGITLKTFSKKHLTNAIDAWPGRSDQFPDTGLKVGMHSGTLAVKQVGVATSQREWKEPVWAGRPVNWAFKCAQQADAHQLICTRSVFGKFEKNAYVTHSCCGEGGPSNSIWENVDMQGKLPADKAPTKVLGSQWCDTHGADFCQAILDGRTTRDDVPVYATGFAQ
jgi:class 3 adenylate cyclase